jgi:hypothetical protein
MSTNSFDDDDENNEEIQQHNSMDEEESIDEFVEEKIEFHDSAAEARYYKQKYRVSICCKLTTF